MVAVQDLVRSVPVVRGVLERAFPGAMLSDAP